MMRKIYTLEIYIHRSDGGGGGGSGGDGGSSDGGGSGSYSPLHNTHNPTYSNPNSIRKHK